MQGYSGRLDMHHLDVYRLANVAEALDLGISELLDDDAVTLIEWGDTITRTLPQDYLEVRIEFGDERRGPLDPAHPRGGEVAGEMQGDGGGARHVDRGRRPRGG